MKLSLTQFVLSAGAMMLVAFSYSNACTPDRIPAPTLKDLSYADASPSEKLDLYLPAGDHRPTPLVIWIHGGGFSVGDKGSMPRRDFGPPPKNAGRSGPFQIQVPDVVALLDKGYAVASLNYRLGSPVISPSSMADGALSAIRDGKAAVRYLRANSEKYGIDPDRFALWGNSAGGYMAAMLGVTGDQSTMFDDPDLGNSTVSSAVQAVVVWFGAEDRLPGADYQIIHYLPTAKRLPRFLIANGDEDPIISASQAKRLNDALVNAGANCRLTILQGVGHEDPAYMSTQMLPTLAFLEESLH